MHLPCIDQGIDFYKEYLARSVYSKTIIIMSLDIKEEGCEHTPCYNEYVHANVTETIENDGYVQCYWS